MWVRGVGSRGRGGLWGLGGLFGEGISWSGWVGLLEREGGKDGPVDWLIFMVVVKLWSCGVVELWS